MAKPKKNEKVDGAGYFRFSLLGLIVFSLALMAGATFMAAKFFHQRQPKAAEVFAVNPKDKSQSVHIGPWGEMVMRDLKLEPPVEMLAANASNPPPDRATLTRLLTRENAVQAGLVIKPDTDVDKIAGYWGHLPGVRFEDIRPLLEALKALPEGGDLRLFYLLPKFARDRVYTYPPTPRAGDPVMDGNWSTFNFTLETPDNRFNEPDFLAQFIKSNYYDIKFPAIYGDLLLLVDEKNKVKHSAVYLASDLVFTKNGGDDRAPWIIMHLPDVVASHPATPPLKVVYLRCKSD